MKFKVIEADWYCIFGDRMGSWRLKSDSVSAQAHYEYELEEYTKNGDKYNYDGPLRYIEKCEDPGFPIREGLKYCVRILPEEDRGSRNHQTTPKTWKGYHCYLYQLGCWWKYKQIQWIFTELYIPKMSLYDYNKLLLSSRNARYYHHNPKLKISRKYLSRESQNDVDYFGHLNELREIGRGCAKNMISFRKKHPDRLKKKSKKKVIKN